MPRAADAGESTLDSFASSWYPQSGASYPSNGLEHSQPQPLHAQQQQQRAAFDSATAVDRQRPRTGLEAPAYASSAAYSSFEPISSYPGEQQHYQPQQQQQQQRLSDAHDPRGAYSHARGDGSDGSAQSEAGNSMYPSGLPYSHGRSPSMGWSSYDAPPQQQQQQQQQQPQHQQQQPNSAGVHGSPSFGARPVPGAEMGSAAGAGSSGAGADYGAYMSMGPPQTSSSYGAGSSLYMHAPNSAGGPGRHDGSDGMGAPQAELTRRRAQTLQEPPPVSRGGYGAAPSSNGQMYGMYASPQLHQREQWGSPVDDEQQRPMSPGRSNSYRGTSAGSLQQQQQQSSSQARRFAPYGMSPAAQPRRSQTGSSGSGDYRMPDMAQGVYAPADQTSPYAGSSTTSTSSGGGGYFGSSSVDASVARYRANSASSALRSPPIMGGGGSAGRNSGATSTPAPPSFAPSHLTDKIVLRALANSSAPDVHYPSAEAMPRTALEPPASDFDVPDEQQEERLPRQQRDKLRFKGDLYTPTWVRGTGNAREAWCDKCPNGGWMQLKNSQYWYHVRGTHGISPTSGLVFLPPLKLRCYADSVGTTEGLCHSCSKWIQICTAKRKRDFSGWFKHSARCHPATSGIGASAYMRDAVLSQPPPTSSTQLPPLPHHLGGPTNNGGGGSGHMQQQLGHSQHSHSHSHSHSGIMSSGAPLTDSGSYGHLVGGMPAASMPSADGSAQDHYRHR